MSGVTAGSALSSCAAASDVDTRQLWVQRTLGAAPWWTARYCADDGQVPELYLAPNTEAEVAFVAARIASLVQQEGVLSPIHISAPTRLRRPAYAVVCLYKEICHL